MSDITWGKNSDSVGQVTTITQRERTKFLIGGLLILAAVVYLVINATTSSTQYFISVDELVNDASFIGENVRISGAVIGETIEYDSENLVIDFVIANITEESTNLAENLYLAVNNPSATRLQVHIENEVMPDLLQHEAQAIVSGRLSEDGIFYANELLLKCPSRYDDGVPAQVGGDV